MEKGYLSWKSFFVKYTNNNNDNGNGNLNNNDSSNGNTTKK